MTESGPRRSLDGACGVRETLGSVLEWSEVDAHGPNTPTHRNTRFTRIFRAKKNKMNGAGRGVARTLKAWRDIALGALYVVLCVQGDQLVASS